MYKVSMKPRKKPKSQKPPSISLPPIAVDLEPEYAQFLDASMQGVSFSSSSWEAPSVASADDPNFPAVLNNHECLLLTEDIIPTDSGGVPEIKQIVPLDHGQLLAVFCSVSSPESLFKNNENVSSTSCVLLLSVNHSGYVPPVSLQKIPISESIVCIRALSNETEQNHSKNSNKRILLAILFVSGQVDVYDCHPPSPSLVTTYQCPNTNTPENGVVDCVYCPATNQLSVVTRDGRLWMLELDQECDEQQEQVDMESLQQGEWGRKLVAGSVFL